MKTLAIIIACAALVTATACEDTTAPETTVPVSTSVTITPLPDASAVVLTDSVVVDFETAVETVTCRANFRLHVGDSLGPVVAGRYRYSNAYRRMAFVPDSALQAQTRYWARLGDGIALGDGNGAMHHTRDRDRLMFDQPPNGALRLQNGLGWSFTTGN